MSDFRFKLAELKNAFYDADMRDSKSIYAPFETVFYDGRAWEPITVRPMLIGNVLLFLVQLPAGGESMALVYNEKDAWSDIEKESSLLTDAVGAAIESHYSSFYSLFPDLLLNEAEWDLMSDIRLN